MDLNTWSPVGGDVIEGCRTLGGIELLEKALDWEADLEGL